jgi:hypothetical protein
LTIARNREARTPWLDVSYRLLPVALFLEPADVKSRAQCRCTKRTCILAHCARA